MGDPVIDRDRTREHLPTRLKYGEVGVEVKKEGGAAGEKETKIFKGFLANSRLVAREGESGDVTELYLSFRDQGDTPSLYKLIQIKIESLRSKVEYGEALTDDEVKEVRQLIDWCPGGDEAIEWQAELTGVAEEQILGTDPKKINDKEVLAASDAWDKLRARDLNRNDQKAKKEADKVEQDEKNGFVVDLYLICRAHGIDPEAIRISDFLGERLKVEKKEDLLKQLVEAEKKRVEARGVAEGKLTVNPVEYWNGQLLEAVEYRFRAMRSPVSGRLVADKTSGDEYVNITRSRDIRKPKHPGDRVYASRLGKTTLASNTVIGKFLDKMHVGEFWRGKAYLDHLYWRIYMGEIIDDSQEMNDEAVSDIFARLEPDELTDSHFRAYTSADALSKFAKDKDFIKALQYLYTLPLFNENNPRKALTQKERLELLAKEMKFESSKDLPQAVTDAVMFSQVFALDAKHLSTSDRRYTVYFLAEFYRKQAMSLYDSEKPESDPRNQMALMWGGPNGILEVLGYNFKLTESPLLMMGFVSPVNLETMDYHALVPDSRPYTPNENPDQLDRVWENVFFYGLQQRDGKLRRVVPKTGRTGYHAGTGELGEYCEYDNKRKDHRQGVFQRIEEVRKEDRVLIGKRGNGKAGYGEILRQEVDFVLNEFLSEKNLGKNGLKMKIAGVDINLQAGEIFYNDALGNLLREYETNPNDSKFKDLQKDQKDLLGSLIRMRDVLQSQVAWGEVWSLDPEEEEMFTGQEDRKDLMFASMYNFAGKDYRDAIIQLISAAPFQSLYELNITPAAIFDTIIKFGQKCRFQSAQTWPSMYKLYLFASTVIEMRMSQMEVPSADSLDQATSPMGDIKLGAWGEKMITARDARVEGIMVEAEKEHEKIYAFLKGRANGERLSFSYLEHMSKLRLIMIGHGFYRGWDEALERQLGQALNQEWLNWNMVNMELTFKNRGWLYEYLAAYHDKYQSVKSYQIPDTVVYRNEAGEIIDVVKRDLLVSDVTVAEANKKAGLYFEWISAEEEGEIEGGVRQGKARDNFQVMSDRSRGAKKSGTVNAGEKIEVVEIRGSWARIKQGWVQINDFGDLNMDSQEINGDMRENETLFEGGRLVWLDGKWEWKTGEWLVDRMRGTMVFVATGMQYVRDKASQTFVPFPPNSNFDQETYELAVGGAGFEKDGTKYADAYYIPPSEEEMKGKPDQLELRKEKEARFPFMVWRTDKLLNQGPEELRDQFYNHRMRMLFSLQFGRTEGVLEGGQDAIALDDHYQEGRASGMGLIRGWYTVQTKMRTMERIVCAREMYKAYLGSVFHTINKGQLYEKGLIPPLEGFEAQGRLWGIDIEVMKNYAAAFPSAWFWDKNTGWRILYNTLCTEVPVEKIGMPQFLNFNLLGGYLAAGGAAIGLIPGVGLWAGLTMVGGFLTGNSIGRNGIAPAIYKQMEVVDPKMIKWDVSQRPEVLAIKKEHLKFRPVQ